MLWNIFSLLQNFFRMQRNLSSLLWKISKNVTCCEMQAISPILERVTKSAKSLKIFWQNFFLENNQNSTKGQDKNFFLKTCFVMSPYWRPLRLALVSLSFGPSFCPEWLR